MVKHRFVAIVKAMLMYDIWNHCVNGDFWQDVDDLSDPLGVPIVICHPFFDRVFIDWCWWRTDVIFPRAVFYYCCQESFGDAYDWFWFLVDVVAIIFGNVLDEFVCLVKHFGSVGVLNVDFVLDGHWL